MSRTLNLLKQRLEIRSSIPEFHPDIPQEILDVPEGGVGVKRAGVTAVHNFSDSPITIPLSAGEWLMQDEGVEESGEGIRLPPLSTAWFRD